jgi:methylmalonyl-CoA/ethylmalonyl-CoA epimerase
MLKKINHIGVAVKNLEETKAFYRDILGLKLEREEELPDQKLKVAMFSIGEVHIELLEATSPESTIAKFIEKKGPGLHHVAFETDGIIDEIKHLEEDGVQMIDKMPRNGAHNTKIAFLHPKSTFSVLTELCQCNCGE